MEKLDKNLKPDKKLAAVCGLFCPACSLFIGTQEEPRRLEAMSARMGKTVDQLTCNGCRSDKLCFYCTSLCKMKSCAAKKGVDFCSQCDEFPCDVLKEFQAERPHRIELWDSGKRIREDGYEQWFRAMAFHYACPQCRALNSAYDMKCRSCGATPSCEYVRLHKDTILAHLGR